MEMEKDKRCILYCRVSSKEQEEKGYSLEAQEKLLQSYAERSSFVISKTFKISESASGKQIRKTFNEMIAYVKKNKINLILCEKIDRLTRNLKDGAIISDWVNDNDKREVHFAKENFVVSRNTKAHENLVWDMKVAIARFYTNNLSEEVKKGQKAKIEAGWIPTGQKFGYKSSGEVGHKTQLPDEKIAPYVKKAFELYNTGNYTIKRLEETLHKEGLRNKQGGGVKKTTIHRFLSDPFYCGYILWNGEEHLGKQIPLISEEVFNGVQEKLKRKYKAGLKRIHEHTFKGLITCGGCGCLITWETQKAHIYGRCKGFKPCPKAKGYIRQDKIETILDELMLVIKPKNKTVLNWINAALKEKNKNKTDYSATTRESMTNALKQIDNRLDKIYEDKIDGVISTEYYKKKYKEYTAKKKEILNEMGKLENRVANYYEIAVEIHELAFNAYERYHSEKTTFDARRTLLTRLFDVMVLNPENNELIVEYSLAFAFLAEWIPKLNATSELLDFGSIKEKTGSLEPAHPVLLEGWDSNPRPIGYTNLQFSLKDGLFLHPRHNLDQVESVCGARRFPPQTLLWGSTPVHAGKSVRTPEG